MLGRLAARLLTGPVAFALAGVVDFAAFGFAALLARVRSGAARPSLARARRVWSRLSRR